ncbi:chorismate--pyruvate lyase family protein [Shewanella colwelliana]|uniref:chorismate--pyruvate lyase family protein n=1 Tax=Shewanella colwelliana TaxID=23 RepID=UPI001BBE08C9|nr:chorismate lyase [Shewanella colwelliana]MCZ4339334.1 chorismate lyase [Shewanella colwelliana]GIU22369.1 putative chorismate pyruvate-lyase [Shewanella colwelliana]
MSVTSLSFPYGESIQWYSPEQIPQLPLQPLKNWLLACGSLTQKLKSHCNQFEVKVLGEDILPPLAGEFPQQQQAWVREVLLCLDGVPWIFARTLVPGTLLQKSTANFLALGSRPLGELLFTSDQFIPGRIEVSQFTPCANLASLIDSVGQSKQSSLWGRRRYFAHHDQALIVCEIFLPAAQAYIEANNLI